MQYPHMNIGSMRYGALFSIPSVGIPSGLLRGQRQATIVEQVRAKAAAPSNIGDGLEVQNHDSPERAENNVRKSDTATFKNMEVVT